MKIHCIFCGDEIPNPTMCRITCNGKECVKKQKHLHKDLRMINEKDRLEYNEYCRDRYKKQILI